MNFDRIRKYVIAFAITLFGPVWGATVFAQVTQPTSPTELIDMANSDAFKTNPRDRMFVFSAMNYALGAEKGAADTPYTDAITTWIGKSLWVPRNYQMHKSQVQALTIANPIDLYLLMGQSNMSGLTESAGWNGPDEEIRTLIQAQTPGRTVITLNCSMPATAIIWWQPEALSFTWNGVKVYSLFRDCVERARELRNALGERATVRGYFFYQGEADASFEKVYPGYFASKWPERYVHMIDGFRDQFGDAPAVHAQLAVTDKTELITAWNAVKTAQTSVVLANSAMITTDDLRTHDGLHLDDCSQSCAGERFATAMLALQGKPAPTSTYCASLTTCWGM